jgi:hypothetical protein
LYQVLALDPPMQQAPAAGVADLQKTLDRIRAAFTDPAAAAQQR